MKRVIVTGATGFIGRHTLLSLINSGYEVHALACKAEEIGIPNLVWHRVDLFDETLVSDLFSRLCPSHLLHFAWYAEHGKFWQSTKNLDWVKASLALIKCFEQSGGKRVVMAGTCAEYDWKHGFCSEYETPCQPSTFYGVCKNALQKIICAYCDMEQISQAWGRVFFNFGPGEHPNRFVASIVNDLLSGKNAKCSHGKQIRDFMFVEDVANAFVALLNSEVQGPVNISSGEAISLNELGLKIQEMAETDAAVDFGAIPVKSGEPQSIIGDCSRLRDEVGWCPVVGIEAGIRQTILWWKDLKVRTIEK